MVFVIGQHDRTQVVRAQFNFEFCRLLEQNITREDLKPVCYIFGQLWPSRIAFCIVSQQFCKVIINPTVRLQTCLCRQFLPANQTSGKIEPRQGVVDI